MLLTPGVQIPFLKTKPSFGQGASLPRRQPPGRQLQLPCASTEQLKEELPKGNEGGKGFAPKEPQNQYGLSGDELRDQLKSVLIGEESAAKQVADLNKEFRLRRVDIIYLTVALLGVCWVARALVEKFVGLDNLTAGNYVTVAACIGLVGYTGTYLLRVFTKSTTYKVQLDQYEEAVMSQRLDQMSEEELNTLLKSVEEEQERLKRELGVAELPKDLKQLQNKGVSPAAALLIAAFSIFFLGLYLIVSGKVTIPRTLEKSGYEDQLAEIQKIKFDLDAQKKERELEGLSQISSPRYVMPDVTGSSSLEGE